MSAHPEIDIVRTPHRFELRVDGELAAYADYVGSADVIELPHTVTQPKFRGRGLAAILVEHILDHVSAAQATVVASCSYVSHFIDQHPQYEHLLAPK